ncbi:MAG: CoA transferase [Rhodospirillaceae bacterium]|nr:CoA transferase [Rhodospirillaceae bacterium]
MQAPDAMNQEPTLPLAGIRVLELGSTVAAPAAGRQLADFGADVIKVEPPEGDHLRTWGELAPDGTSWWFKSHNRGKRFVRLDLHKPEDAAAARALALECDVVLENFRPGKLAEWGLGYDDLRREKPDIVYVSISGYGQDGPYAARPGFGHIAESMSGVRYVTGFPDRAPVRVGLSIGDEIAGLYAVIGALMALRARDAGGGGDHVDVSLLESMFSITESLLPDHAAVGKVTERSGNRYLRAAPSNTYGTSDGRYISIAANSEPIFRRLCRAMGEPALAEDARFATNQARVANTEALDARIEAWLAGLTLAVALEQLAAAGVPAGPVYSIADIAADPHYRARGALATVTTEDGGPIATPGLVPRLRHHPGRLDGAAKRVGADQEAVMRTLGLARGGSR